MWRNWSWKLFKLFNVFVIISYYAEPPSFFIEPYPTHPYEKIVGGKYSKWIMILQEFDLEFEHAKSNKSLVFSEFICDFPSTETETVAEDSFPDESLFMISSDDL
jgi:hypothetical protein